jgi:hypothetical protein
MHSSSLKILLFTDPQLLIFEDVAYMCCFPHNELFELFVWVLRLTFGACYEFEHKQVFLEEVDENRHCIEDDEIHNNKCLEHFATASVAFPVTVELVHQHVS